MRIAILILYTQSWQPLADIVLPNVEKYCGRYHYSFFFNRLKEYDGFDKVRAIKATFKRGECDVIWSLDCDTLITDHGIKIEDILEDGKDFFITKDYNGLNAGSFIIRNSSWSEEVIEYLLNLQGEEGMHCEQNAIEKYINEFPNDDKIKILPQNKINSYLYQNYPEIPLQTHEQGQWNVGDLLFHLPGLGMGKRLEILSGYKQHIIYE